MKPTLVGALACVLMLLALSELGSAKQSVVGNGSRKFGERKDGDDACFYTEKIRKAGTLGVVQHYFHHRKNDCRFNHIEMVDNCGCQTGQASYRIYGLGTHDVEIDFTSNPVLGIYYTIIMHGTRV